ncbi:starch-binding protein [Flavobacterium sp. CYK-4]|uniref:starch-binding protein n=1 Tax=Flavobacterium lotistagni TaxID=2709660 RepID=UPI00140B2DDB|nr:starch-binding protein [Flavobacterium lotistagni]NHM05903.1 starch-binding protein [Flavobacterium lotistagni]
MKTKLTRIHIVFALVGWCFFGATQASAQSAANVNDIMLQAFGWDVHTQSSVANEGGLYNYLKNRSAGYAASGFNVIWLPPPSKSTGGVGYIPTELFNFSQTVYGSEAQLRAMLTAFNGSSPRIHPMADIVVNHRGGTTNWTDFTNPTWDCHSITNNDEANYVAITGVRPCGNADTGEDFNGARDLDHTNLQVQNGVKEYLTRLKGLGFDSWRWDVAKGFSAGYFGDYINASAPYASVGEYWDGNVNALKSWINGTGNRSAAFDFALYYNALQPAINNGNYAALAGNPGLAGQFGYADKAVTFIDNHDTFVKPGSFVSSDNIMKGYAFILTHPGMPCVFFPHYNGGTYSKDGVTVTYTNNKVAIDKLMAIRRNNGINAYSSVVVSNSGSFYSATIDNKVVVKIGPGLWNPGTGWVLKTSGTDYAVWERESVTDVPSLTVAPAGGSFVSGTTTNVVLTANNSSSTIYYTLDGSTPTTASASAVGTKSLVITATTTVKAFVRNTAGASSAINTQVYTFSTPPTFTVYFKKPAAWNSAVKIYYWNVTGTAPAAAWPGVAMTLDCGSWYKFTFPATVSASSIIFNDGTSQTPDLTATAGIRYYDNAWLASEPANRCPVAAPVLSVSQAGGTFTSGTSINVSLTANVSTFTIYYTLDGSTPTTASPSAIGTKALSITSNTTLKAFVRNTAGVNSAIRTEVYNFSAPTTFTVYFKKPSNWGNAVKIYYWNVTGTATAVTWPGVAMTQDCGSWYKYTFPATVSASSLIFNDGSLQTADLAAAAGIRYYDNAWLASEPVNRCPASMTVYFKPPTSWTTAPKIHYWNALPTGSAANTTWPGMTMNADVNGFYKYTIVGPTSVNIVFNNGNSGTGNQTADLLNKTNGFSYTWGAAARMSDENTSDAAATVYPNPVIDWLQIETKAAISNFKLLNLQGAILKQGQTGENSIQMSDLTSGIYFLQIQYEDGREEVQKVMKK